MYLRIIPTCDDHGQPNGSVIPIWHSDEDLPIGQVYLTTILPGMSKGPHLHKVRSGRFTVVAGEVLIVVRSSPQLYTPYVCAPYSTIAVDPGHPAALYNLGKTEALVLNMPNPPWRVDDTDEWPVENWTFDVRKFLKP